MRLIDAEKIHRSRAKITEGSKSFYKEWFSASAIDNAPTVEAIPIEWIDGYIKRRANDVNIYAEILFISDMVEEWNKENDRN